MPSSVAKPVERNLLYVFGERDPLHVMDGRATVMGFGPADITPVVPATDIAMTTGCKVVTHSSPAETTAS